MKVPFGIDQMCPTLSTGPQILKDKEGLFFLSPKLLKKGCWVLRGRALAPAVLADCGQQAPGPVEQDTLTRPAEPCPLPRPLGSPLGSSRARGRGAGQEDIPHCNHRPPGHW